VGWGVQLPVKCLLPAVKRGWRSNAAGGRTGPAAKHPRGGDDGERTAEQSMWPSALRGQNNMTVVKWWSKQHDRGQMSTMATRPSWSKRRGRGPMPVKCRRRPHALRGHTDAAVVQCRRRGGRSGRAPARRRRRRGRRSSRGSRPPRGCRPGPGSGPAKESVPESNGVGETTELAALVRFSRPPRGCRPGPGSGPGAVIVLG
jgi:hypothetical protein